MTRSQERRKLNERYLLLKEWYGKEYAKTEMAAHTCQPTDINLIIQHECECLAAPAGPLANLFLAGLAMRGRLFLLAGLSLGQGLFNLLPILPLDGGRCLYFLLTGLLDGALADRALRLTSAIAAGLLLGAGLVLSRQFGNLTLLITSLWLSAGLFRSWRWESAAQ